MMKTRPIGFTMDDETNKTKRISGVSIFNYLAEYQDKNGRFPQNKTISKKFSTSEEKVSMVLNKFADRNKIRKKGNTWEITDANKLLELNKAKHVDADITTKELKVIKKIVMIFSLFGTVILATLSIRFTWLQYKDLIGSFWGLLASFAIVGTMLISHQVKIILAISKKAKFENYCDSVFWNNVFNFLKRIFNPQVWLFRLIFFAALSISIFSTIFTQVGSVLENRKDEKIASSENSNNVIIYNNLTAEIKQIEKAIDLNNENRSLYRVIANKSKEGSQDRRDANWWLNRYEKEAKELDSKLEIKNTQINKLLATDIVLTTQGENYEIYQWLENVTGKSKRFFELLLSVAFAIFIDVAATLLLSVALLIRRKA